ncbi:MAG: hypothetical protein OSA98_18315 [Rubripirellula sp.]|nr:hypothetical protein [Rubripirellula sp.]
MKGAAKQKLIDNVVLVGYFAATPACFYFLSDLGTAFLASLPIFGIFCFWLAYRGPFWGKRAKRVINSSEPSG